MKLLANNLYLVTDPLQLITAIEIAPGESGGSVIEVTVGGASIDIYIPPESAGGELRVTTTSSLFTLPIVEDQNELTQLYSLHMESSGLVSSVGSSTTVAGGGATAGAATAGAATLTLEPDTSAFFHDEFWQAREFTVQLNDDVLVDSVELVVPTGPASNLTFSVLQSGTLVTIIFDPQPHLILETASSVHLLFHTNHGVLSTSSFLIEPRDPSLSECVVGGTLFEQATTNELALTGSTSTVTFTLRFETFTDDLTLLRTGLLSVFDVEPFFVCDDQWFSGPRSGATNTFGFASLIAEANVQRTADGSAAVITFGRSLQIEHPERITFDAVVPAQVLRSARSTCPLVVPFVKTIQPGIGQLRVQDTAQTLTEHDFWNGARITLQLEGDLWQDVSALTTPALDAFRDLIRSGLVSSSSAWSTMIANAQLTLSTDASLTRLHVDVEPQTSATFNLSTTIEVSVDLALEHVNGFISRQSGQEFADVQHYFVVAPVQAFLSITRVTVEESDIWSGGVDLPCTLHLDELIVSADTLSAHLTSSFASVFPDSTLGDLVVDLQPSATEFTIRLPAGSPGTFNINTSTTFIFQIPGSFLRNGSTLTAPAITFSTTAVLTTVHGVEGRSRLDVQNGFTFQVTLTNDSWAALATEPPVLVLARQHTEQGWNATVRSHLVFAIDAANASTLSVTIPPTGAYYIDSVEVVDIVVQASATFNQRRVYVTNFTIQGASLLERQHHTYLQTLTDLRSVVLALRRSVNSIKTNLARGGATTTTTDNFEATDTIFTRLRKLNASSISNPISVCRPKLVNGVPSADALAFTVRCQEALTHSTSSALPTRRSIPLLVPRIDSSQGTRLHTLILNRPTSVLITVDGVEQHLAGAQVYVVTLSASSVLVVVGSPTVVHATFTA